MQHCSFPSEQTQPQLLLISAHLVPLSCFMISRQRIKESEDGELTYQSEGIGKKGEILKSGVVMMTGEVC